MSGDLAVVNILTTALSSKAVRDCGGLDCACTAAHSISPNESSTIETQRRAVSRAMGKEVLLAVDR